jgi:AcrR family transcriptional regulator
MAPDPTAGSDRHPPPGSEDPTPSRGPGRQRLLTHDGVALAAFDLVDTEGPAALTMSRLGKRLGVSAMTLYGYAESKDAIVAMLAELLLADLPPVPRETPWTEAVETTFLTVYRRFVVHRHVTEAITHGGVFIREQAKLIEELLTCLEEAGFSQADAFTLQRTVATYTVGFAFFAIAEHATASRQSRMNWTETLDPTEFPRLADASALFAAEVDETQYLRGLRQILAGLEPSASER